MGTETYAVAKKTITDSKLFSSGEPFLIKDLSADIGLASDFVTQVLCQMVEGGQASKKREKKCKRGGIVWLYRKCTLKPRDYLCASYRRHTNDELGLEPLYAWAVL